MSFHIDQHARATCRVAEMHLSVGTSAELHRRRIAACTLAETARTGPRWRSWPLSATLGGTCVLTLTLLFSTLLPDASTPTAVTARDAIDTLDALDTINLTALDEDSDFFLWLASHEASLLAME